MAGVKTWVKVSENNTRLENDWDMEKSRIKMSQLLKTDTRITLNGITFDIYAWLEVA